MLYLASISFHAWEITMKLLSENMSIDQFYTVSHSYPPNAHFQVFVADGYFFKTASSEITTFNTYKS